MLDGECIPLSFIAFRVAPSFRSGATSPSLIQHAIPTRTSPSPKPIGSFPSEKFLLRFLAMVLLFFIAGPVYPLRFKRLEIGSVLRPVGDRLFHPIWLQLMMLLTLCKHCLGFCLYGELESALCLEKLTILRNRGDK